MAQVLSYDMPQHLKARQAAKRHESLVQVACVVIAISCFVGAGLLMRPINTMRQDYQLVIDPESLGTLPPDIALLGKLGTFRALAIDWASIRAERLKEEGKTYEAHQLHLTVCRLAPRFPRVWVNAAWNMVYNISVMKYTPEERWQWVQNGIKLLRDEGIRYNPRSVSIYKELAWIYWHKIGDIMDDEHLSYKRALAVEMERVLGAPVIALTDEEYFDWFREIVDAPRDLDQMLANDNSVSQLAAHLETAGLKPDRTVLDFAARHIRPELAVAHLLKDKGSDDPVFAARLEILTDPERSKDVARLLAAVRSKILREEYGFDLDRMLHMMVEQYGPLDWRNAFAHTLYWSSLGSEVSFDYANTDLADAMNTARLVFFSLQSMVMRGKIVLWPDFDDPFASYIELSPDARLIPYLYETYMRLGKKHFGNDPKFVEGTPGPKYTNGFVSNMQSWIQVLYAEGGEKNLAQAENFYAWLRDNNRHPDDTVQDRYLQTLDDFVMGDVLNQLWTSKAANALVKSWIRRGLKQLGLGLAGGGMRSFEIASKSRLYWMSSTDSDISDRRQMPVFAVMVRDEIESIMTQTNVAPLFRARLWQTLPLEQRQMIYDRLKPYYVELCAAQDPPWDPNTAFEEPPGMERFRKQSIKTRRKSKHKDIETGELFNR